MDPPLPYMGGGGFDLLANSAFPWYNRRDVFRPKTADKIEVPMVPEKTVLLNNGGKVYAVQKIWQYWY